MADKPRLGCARLLGVADDPTPDAPLAPPALPILLAMEPVETQPNPPWVEPDAPPLAPSPSRPPLTEVPVDEERAILAGVLPGSEKGVRRLRGDAKQLIRSGSALGKFAAHRLLEKPSARESELLNHRAKVAFYDASAMCVPMYFNELGKNHPNKVILDGAMAAMRGAGIVVDSTPLSQADRTKAVDEAIEVSSMSQEQLLARVTQRLAAMRSSPAGEA